MSERVVFAYINENLNVPIFVWYKYPQLLENEENIHQKQN